MENNTNSKFPEVARPRWGSNENVHTIMGLVDFIKDEYGNYYTPYKITTQGGKISKVTLVHVLYDEAFSTIFTYEVERGYNHSHLGEVLLDRMNGHVKELEIEDRTIFTVQDLINSGIEVKFWDITYYKSQNKGK